MGGSWQTLWVTLQVVLYALLPPRRVGTPCPRDPLKPGSLGVPAAATPCSPLQIYDGLERLLNAEGELNLLIAGARGIAGPVLMFRLKRQGFSRCTVQAAPEGLYLRAKR